MGKLGVTLTSMAPVVLTVVGSKVIPQFVKGDGERVTDAAVEELLMSLPICITKGSVVMAGLGFVMPLMVIVAVPRGLSAGNAPDIVRLLLVVAQEKVVEGVKSSSTESQLGVDEARLYFDGKTTIMSEPEGTG